jgi:succinyl-diaminopimelate desuccinylase
VPVSGTWRHGNPFSGAVEKGLIYGRGTADMKGSIASLLTALDALSADADEAEAMNVEVSFTADEETDSFLGARWVVDHAPIKPDYAIVMEGGGGRRGVLRAQRDALAGGHGPRPGGPRVQPQDGSTPWRRWRRWSRELDAYKRQIARRTFVTPEGKTMRPTINLGRGLRRGPGARSTPFRPGHFLDRPAGARD